MKRLTPILLLASAALAAAPALAASRTSAEASRAADDALAGDLKVADKIGPRMAKLRKQIDSLASPRATARSQNTSIRKALAEVKSIAALLPAVKSALSAAEGQTGGSGGEQAVDGLASELERIRQALEERKKQTESGDTLENFEIQDLMSRYNEAESRSSALLKKVDDTNNSAGSKVG